MKANVIMLTSLHILRDKLITTKLICTLGKVYVFSTFSLKYLDYIMYIYLYLTTKKAIHEAVRVGEILKDYE